MIDPTPSQNQFTLPLGTPKGADSAGSEAFQLIPKQLADVSFVVAVQVVATGAAPTGYGVGYAGSDLAAGLGAAGGVSRRGWGGSCAMVGANQPDGFTYAGF